MSSSAYDDPKAGERIAALFSKSDREELDRLRLEKKIREGQADADALRELALYHCPSDIVSFAAAHRLPTFVEAARRRAVWPCKSNSVGGLDEYV